ncbi:MAG: hypothetical protein V1725_00670 [archaeon]
MAIDTPLTRAQISAMRERLKSLQEYILANPTTSAHFAENVEQLIVEVKATIQK